VRKTPVFLWVFLLLSVLWYFAVGTIDSVLMSHKYSTFSNFCYRELLPAGTVHGPEGSPSFPGGAYSFDPLGVECAFGMRDGSVVKSFQVRYFPLAAAAIPLLTSLSFFVFILLRRHSWSARK